MPGVSAGHPVLGQRQEHLPHKWLFLKFGSTAVTEHNLFNQLDSWQRVHDKRCLVKRPCLVGVHAGEEEGDGDDVSDVAPLKEMLRWWQPAKTSPIKNL